MLREQQELQSGRQHTTGGDLDLGIMAEGSRAGRQGNLRHSHNTFVGMVVMNVEVLS